MKAQRGFLDGTAQRARRAVNMDEFLSHNEPGPPGAPPLASHFDPLYLLLPNLTSGIVCPWGRREGGARLGYLKRLQLLFQWQCQTPSSVNIPWRKSMRSWGVIHNKFHHVSQFSDFIRETLHDVLYQHAHYLLGFIVLPFD